MAKYEIECEQGDLGKIKYYFREHVMDYLKSRSEIIKLILKIINSAKEVESPWRPIDDFEFKHLKNYILKIEFQYRPENHAFEAMDIYIEEGGHILYGLRGFSWDSIDDAIFDFYKTDDEYFIEVMEIPE